MKVLVTGAAGFIGYSLATRLLARGDEVIGVDIVNDYYDPRLKEARLARLAQQGGGRFTFLRTDFADYPALTAALEGAHFDRIVHLGAQAGVRYSIENPHAYVQSNLVGHVNLLEVARHRGVEHMVYASSSSVYGGNTKLPFSVDDRVDHPLSLYAATKKADELMSETYAHLYRLPLTGLRFFTVYGPWGRPDMMMWLFTRAILAGEPIQVFNHGDMYRDFTYVDDIVSGVVACLDNPPLDDGAPKAGGSLKPHRLYNIGNHKSEHLMKVIAILEAELGRKAEMRMLPMQPGDVRQSFADIDAISGDLGYRPTTGIETGVPNFVRWYKDYHGL
ncbi:NAD-dependent epimerase/dehydratase [Novosphingobium aromaticivorans DSM 12444]|uniref:NAD-dependent epimerase/dehydratase n=1 Tax=Novosphingobium aromaticivorans (strain ATCC 700278 / DSM 12444 / CCUG 56034 / CIP 105152 / NBRC 16084 / F199) TaxID=279238 RepID=Q2G3I7_NOVAD|nr:SDR family NAD(P)-dependent oxidoreductase [Novosphingobium aromaticivorans]ABD27586.1 NAD-dependent epimerase/dehydratase [Novosphingobium aromaticivorans DSM 12444]SCY71991.1 UDP-glucuronate 4-epimerase [Novosphingobium aromaticivorans]